MDYMDNTETAQVYSKSLREEAKAVLRKAKKQEKLKLKNGYHWVRLDDKTVVLRKHES